MIYNFLPGSYLSKTLPNYSRVAIFGNSLHLLQYAGDLVLFITQVQYIMSIIFHSHSSPQTFTCHFFYGKMILTQV